MNTNKAISYVKKYKLFKLVPILLAFLVAILILTTMDVSLIFAYTLFYVVFVRACSNLAFRKYILNPLYNDLDIVLHKEILKAAKVHHPSYLWNIQGEYFSGNYEAVVNLCEAGLRDKKLSKFKCDYIIRIASVYFDRDDLDKLGTTCARFDEVVSSLSIRKAKRVKRRAVSIAFYKHYIANDFEACREIIYKPQNMNISGIRNLYFKARLALLMGENENAKKLFEDVIKASPNLNFAILSKHALESIEKSVPYNDTFDPIEINEEATIPPTPRSHTILRVIFKCALILLSIAFAFYIGLRAYARYQEKKFEEEIWEYYEKVRLIVEEDHDGVVVLDAFNLKRGDEDVDSLFICKTDKSVIIASHYSLWNYDGTFYDVKYEMPLSDLEKNTSPLMYLVFNATTSDNSVEAYLYTDESDLPSTYEHLSKVKVNGHDLYFVVTKIIDSATFTLPI